MTQRNGQSLQRHAFPGQRIVHAFLTHLWRNGSDLRVVPGRSADRPLARLSVRARLALRTEARMQSYRAVVTSGALRAVRPGLLFSD